MLDNRIVRDSILPEITRCPAPSYGQCYASEMEIRNDLLLLHMNEIDAAKKQEAEEYLQLDIDSLYSLIPPFVPSYKGTSFRTEGQIEAGKGEFAKVRENLTHIVCEEWKLCEKIKTDKFKDSVQLVVSMADIIAAHSGYIPPFLASTILFKMGVRALCNCPD